MYYKDLTGQKFGKLTVLKYSHSKNHRSYWLCQCECGNTTIVSASELRTENTKSCGCLRVELLLKRSITHGGKHTKLYDIWTSLKGRTLCKTNQRYADYGGRGITICAEWLDFTKFEQWAKLNGYREGLTLDRIDNNKGYSPSNCRWTTYKEQNWNKRNNHFITYKGETHCLAEWAEILGIKYSTLRSRVRAKKPIEAIFYRGHFKTGVKKYDNI